MKQLITLTIVTLAITSQALASDFFLNGKPVTKGECIVALAKDKNAECVKQDRVYLDMEKGTLKNVKADKK